MLSWKKSTSRQARFTRNPVVDIDFRLPADAWRHQGRGTLPDQPVLSNEELPQLLIVDHDAGIRAFVRQIFAQGYDALEASNGADGMSLAEAAQPSVIIIDIRLPRVSGIEMCRRLKANSTTSHIPIVLLTAKETEESKLEGLMAGADHCLKKPIHSEILRFTISNLIKSRTELRKRFAWDMYLQPSRVAMMSAYGNFLKQAIALAEKNMENPKFNVGALVRELGMSRSKLHLKMKALTGQSCSEFIRTIWNERYSLAKKAVCR